MIFRRLGAALLAVFAGRVAGAELSSITTDDIVRIARVTDGVTSTLHALPSEFRENFLLAFAPRGNQPGTAAFPRAFYFGRHAVLAYGACPGAPNLNALEVMDLRDPVPRLIEIDFAAGPARVTGNPAACLTCHGRDVRPLWPSGVATGWEGFYGAGHAYLTRPWEDARLAEFKATARTHARYSSISGLARYTAYMSSPHGLYDLNATFEDVLVAGVVRRAISDLAAHPNFRRAAVPLLGVLGTWRRQGQEVIPLAAYARVIAPHLGITDSALRARLDGILPRIEALARDHARREWRVMERATGQRPTDVAVTRETDPRHVNVITALAHITEIFGLDQFNRSVSTSRTANPFGIPGLSRLNGGLLKLEQGLFDLVLGLTRRTAAELGRAPGWSRDPFNPHFTQWPGGQELEHGLRRLAADLGQPPSCGDLLLM